MPYLHTIFYIRHRLHDNRLRLELVLPIHHHIPYNQLCISSHTTAYFIRQYQELSVFFLEHKNRHTITSVSLNTSLKKLRSNRNYRIFLIFSMVRFYVLIKRTFYKEIRHCIFPQGIRQFNPL